MVILITRSVGSSSNIQVVTSATLQEQLLPYPFLVHLHPQKFYCNKTSSQPPNTVLLFLAFVFIIFVHPPSAESLFLWDYSFWSHRDAPGPCYFMSNAMPQFLRSNYLNVVYQLGCNRSYRNKVARTEFIPWPIEIRFCDQSNSVKQHNLQPRFDLPSNPHSNVNHPLSIE